jgi:putative Ca2+/H+ antiporter (TMEM165/GDT1 family)
VTVCHTEASRFFLQEGAELSVFIGSMIFVVLAEMFDKTQLLAMCFAARYRCRPSCGRCLWLPRQITCSPCSREPPHYLHPHELCQYHCRRLVYHLGLWTIRGDTVSCETDNSGRSPFWIVAIAFFIAECGDKTQLAT